MFCRIFVDHSTYFVNGWLRKSDTRGAGGKYTSAMISDDVNTTPAPPLLLSFLRSKISRLEKFWSASEIITISTGKVYSK